MKRKMKTWMGAAAMLVALAMGSSIPIAANDAFAKETEKEMPVAMLLQEAMVDSEALRDLEVYPGGMPFGVRFLTEGVTVVGFCEEKECGGPNPAQAAGLQLRDVILSVDGQKIESASMLSERLEGSGGKPMVLHCRRGKKELDLTLKPIWNASEGKYKSGIWVRDSGAGIGTVTFLLPDGGAFGGLGHGICDGETGELIPMKRGTVSGVTISSVVKGVAGKPGELKGYFNNAKTGVLLGNSTCGVWGIFSELPENSGEPIPVGLKEDLTEGEAEIFCTVDGGGIGRYRVEISAIKPEATGSKCFTVRVTDEKLIEKTGGIVQGMSGSPILQNGKLVGALTHVLVNDPTKGYGIFLENMLINLPVLVG